MNVSITTGFTCFNSTLVQLKVPTFLLMSVKTQGFNSTLVQLKGKTCQAIASVLACFNSTLVQLKGWPDSHNSSPLFSFNSTLVQLKAVKNANKYTSKSMIYHPFILIFYKHLQSTFNS